MKKNTINHLHLPVGEVVSGSIPAHSEHEFMPIVGWTAIREKIHTPLIMVRAIALTEGTLGVLQFEFPVYDHTRDQTLWFLETLGWSGKLWKAHIPDDADVDEVTQYADLLSSMNLDDSLFFESPRAVKVKVERSKGPFLLPQIEPPSDFEVHFKDEFAGLMASMVRTVH